MEEQEELVVSAVVARADALMQRRRPHSPAEDDDLPMLTEVIDPDADLPVLVSDLPEPTEDEPPALEPAVVDILAHELARRLGERLADEIPDLVATALQSALASVTDELRQGLADATEAAIRDFLDERERLARIRHED